MSPELFKRGSPENRVSWSGNRRDRSQDRRRALLHAAKISLGVMVMVAAGFLAPLAAGNLRGIVARQDSLMVKTLMLEGNVLVTREQVVEALGVGRGDNLVELNLRDAARRLEEFPAVKRALLRKEYPSILAVRLEERVPLMVLLPEGYLVDEEGIVMGRVAVPREGLPTISGLGTIDGRRLADPAQAAVVASLRDASLKLGLAWPGYCAALDFSATSGPAAIVGAGIPARLGHGSYEEKLARLAAVLPRVLGAETAVDYVDLRFEGRAVVGTHPPEPEPKAAAPEGGGAMQEQENISG